MFKYFILLSSGLLAFCAAWFSVSGISQLFVGAPTAAMLMAISLELGKLVSVSFLYRYWSSIAVLIRWYMTIGSIVLMLITSVGVYGYLSSAYAVSAQSFSGQMVEVESFKTQARSLTDRLQATSQRLDQLYTIRGQQESRLNDLVGKPGFVTQQRVVQSTDRQIAALQSDITQLTAQRDSIHFLSVTREQSIQSNSKLGTFYYVSKTIGVSLDTTVQWFIFVIVFVFDPMSLALLIAYNSIVGRSKAGQESPLPEDIEWVPPPITKQEPKPSVQLESPDPPIEPKPWWGRPDGGQTIG